MVEPLANKHACPCEVATQTPEHSPFRTRPAGLALVRKGNFGEESGHLWPWLWLPCKRGHAILMQRCGELVPSMKVETAFYPLTEAA